MPKRCVYRLEIRPSEKLKLKVLRGSKKLWFDGIPTRRKILSILRRSSSQPTRLEHRYMDKATYRLHVKEGKLFDKEILRIAKTARMPDERDFETPKWTIAERSIGGVSIAAPKGGRLSLWKIRVWASGRK